MKLFSAKNLLQQPDSKFIFEVGGGSEFSGSGVETRQAPVAAGAEKDESVKDLYEKIRGQMKPEEISNETQQKLFEQYTKFDTTEKAADFRISENNTAIAGHKKNVETLSAERKQLLESNDSEDESEIIAGLMPHSHEDFINYVKTNRPAPEAIVGFLQNAQLEGIEEDQIQEVSALASEMVVNLNKVDELQAQIQSEESKIGDLQALNRAEETKKEENRKAATLSFQHIVDANIPPAPEDAIYGEKAPSLTEPNTYADRHSEIPEAAATATGETLVTSDQAETDESQVILGLKETAIATTFEISDSHEAISNMIRETNLSPEAQQKIIDRIKELEYNPDATEEEIVAFILAGIEGLTAEQLKSSPYYRELLNKLELIKRRNEIQQEIAGAQKQELTEKLGKIVEVFIENDTFFSNVLSAESSAKLGEIRAKLEEGDQINFEATLAVITQITREVELATPSGSDAADTFDRHDLRAFEEQKRSVLTTLDRYGIQLRNFQSIQEQAKARAEQAEATRATMQEQIDSYAKDPAKLEAGKAIAASRAFLETGTVSAPLATYLMDPDSDFSPENVQKVVNLLNSDDYLNATPEQQAQLFQNAGINLNSSEFTPSNAQIITPEIQGWAADTPGVTIEGIDPENGLIIVSLGNDEESEYRLDPEKGLIHQKGLDTAFSDDLYIDADKPAAAQAMGGLIKSQYLSTSDSPAFDARAFGNNELNEFLGNYYAKRGSEPLPYSEAQAWETLGQALRIANSGLGALVEATSNEDATNDLTGEVTLSSAGTKAASSRIEAILDRARAVTPDQLAIEIKAILGN